MTEKPAKGITGFLIYDADTDDYIFRIYSGAKEPDENKEHDDYLLMAEDIKVTIESSIISLYEKDGVKWLDWSGYVSKTGPIPPGEQKKQGD